MGDPADTTTRTGPSLAVIADVFTRNANFTLGGGSATVAVMHRELLDKRQWLSPDDFTLRFALARLTPGTNLLAFCTCVGWLLRGMAGAVVALLAASIPCTVVVVVAMTGRRAKHSRYQGKVRHHEAGSFADHSMLHQDTCRAAAIGLPPMAISLRSSRRRCGCSVRCACCRSGRGW